jgi:low temperature requirement protein LtrA
MGLLKTSKHLALRPVAARDPKENHRVATPLELLFDLIFVVAIAEAGQQLHHAIIENHLGSACHITLWFFRSVVGMDEFYLVRFCL